MQKRLAIVPPARNTSSDTPALRLFALIEVLANSERRHSLQTLVDEMALPKATLHRMLQQLESAGMLLRDGDGRHYAIGPRLRQLAESLLLNDSHHGARHAVLRRLVHEVGESCNITTLSGSEVVYLDRVETAAPLRFYLHAGSRVPAHCSASGKVLLAQMSPARRQRLLGNAPLERYTPNTKVDPEALEAELQQVRRDGYALDDEEFLPGLLCIAVRVARANGPANLCIAIQAPIVRMDADKARQWLPALRRAAAALTEIDAHNPPDRAGHP